MDFDKTKEELINELSLLKQDFNNIKAQYEEKQALLNLAEEKGIQSEEKFRQAILTSPDAIIISRMKDGMFVFANEGFTKLSGYRPKEVIGKTSIEINIWDDTRKRDDLVKELQKSGKVENFETVFCRKDGSRIYGLLSASLIELDGSPHLLSAIKDITIRKHREIKIRVLYGITQGVTTSDNLDELLKLIHKSLKEVLYAENCFVALVDEKTEQFSFPYFVDKHFSKPEPYFIDKSCTSYVYRTNKPLLLTKDIFDKLVDSKEIDEKCSSALSWVGIPLQSPSRTMGVMVLQDYEKKNVYSNGDVRFLVSIGSQIAMSIERKKAEEEIKLKNEMLQEINAEKDKFFSILAHDLRGPLSAFVDATQILIEDIQSMGVEEIGEITKSMKKSATNIYDLLENLLKWSRLKRGVMKFVPEKLNLKSEIDNCIDILSESSGKKNIKILVSVSDRAEIFADKQMIASVFRNLISNAIKFTKKSGSIEISVVNGEGCLVETRIKDSGIGIPSELKEKLFMLSEKTNRNGTEGEPSTGLGLLLCKEFIDKHDGAIWVESEEGKGSTFFFTIPGRVE